MVRPGGASAECMMVSTDCVNVSGLGMVDHAGSPGLDGNPHHTVLNKPMTSDWGRFFRQACAWPLDCFRHQSSSLAVTRWDARL